MHVHILNQLQLLWLATQAKFKANISVTSAVLATMLNQRVERKALIREAFFQSYKGCIWLIEPLESSCVWLGLVCLTQSMPEAERRESRKDLK